MEIGLNQKNSTIARRNVRRSDEAILLNDRHATADIKFSEIKQSLAMGSKILALPLRGLIWVYQHTLSPDHGPTKRLYPAGYCKFYPSCSSYADIVLKERGVLGLPKIAIRIIKCRPGAHPCVDLP